MVAYGTFAFGFPRAKAVRKYSCSQGLVICQCYTEGLAIFQVQEFLYCLPAAFPLHSTRAACKVSHRVGP